MVEEKICWVSDRIPRIEVLVRRFCEKPDKTGNLEFLVEACDNRNSPKGGS